MLTFDIETIPLDATMALPYPADDRRAPANYKSEEAIAKWRESDEAAWQEGRVKEASLNPRLGRVLAIGTKATGQPTRVSVAPAEANEAEILTAFWAEWREWRQVAGFNSINFDLPFLMVRSLMVGVDVPMLSPYLRRYSATPHLDVRMILTNWDQFGKGKLGEWSAAMGGPDIVGDGADVYALHLEGNYAAVAAHCLSDVEATAFLAERVRPVVGMPAAEPEGEDPEQGLAASAAVLGQMAESTIQTLEQRAGGVTSGVVVCDPDGHPVWTGNPENTRNPRIIVYSDEDVARRALTRTIRGTEAAGAESGPLCLGMAVIKITHLGDPITPRRRD